jgi:hypothetical protein
MASVDSATKRRNECLKNIREIESKLGSIEVINFIQQTKLPAERTKFFDLKSEIAIRRSKLEIEILDTIAIRLERLEDDLNQGITNVNTELSNLKNITEVLKAIDVLVGVLSRIFV